ncbi:MAG: hypothetical protein LBU06_10060 [Desulfovibrio sp.]|nr:hypothetical protein [Desulfovibrio sp.]
MTIAGKTLLALWARDLEDFPDSAPGALRSLCGRHVPLAMEPAAIGLLEAQGLPCLPHDAWLSADARSDAIEKGLAQLDAWAEVCGPKSLPELMRGDLMFPFMSLGMAEALAGSWREHGARRIYCLERAPMAAGYWHESDVPLAIWKDTAPDMYSAIPVAPPSFRRKNFISRKARSIRRLTRKIRDMAVSAGRSLTTPPLKGGIVFFVSQWELFRHAHIIRQTQKLGRPLTLFLIDGTKEGAASAQRDFQVAVRPLPVPARISGQGADEAAALEKLLRCYPVGAKLLSGYIGARAAGYQSFRRDLADLLSSSRPALAVAPHSQDAVVRLCERACLDCGVPTITIPHAAVENIQYSPMHEDDPHLLALTSPLIQAAYEENAAATRSQVVDDIFVTNEYPVRNLPAKEQAKPCLLFIFAICQTAPWLHAYDGPTARLELLRRLAVAPQRLDGDYDILFKLHPTWPEKELFSAAGVSPERILPLDSDLGSLLGATAVLITVNYSSSPSIQAIRNNIPLLHVNTMSGRRKRFMNNLEKKFFELRLPFAWSGEEAWAWIDRLCYDVTERERALSFQESVVKPNLAERHTGWLECANAALRGGDWPKGLPFRKRGH